MTDTPITYNYGGIDTTHDDVGSDLQAMAQIKDDVRQIFQTLEDVYEAEGHQALVRAHAALDQQLDDCMDLMRNSNTALADQSQAMADLDRAQAARLA